jgi:predicted RNase H-like nuclease (RuvC/YqgF family)
MSNEKPRFYHKKPFGVRITDEEINFIEENFDDLFDGDETIAPRKAFILLCEKALAKVLKNKQSLPEDLARIKELENENRTFEVAIKEAKARLIEISSQFNDCVNRKINAEKEVETLSERVLKLTEALRTKETEENQPPVELEPLPTERLLKLSNFESFILEQIEKAHGCDAKEILINRFFMVYQRRGNGDYDIKRITPANFAKLENLAKSQE